MFLPKSTSHLTQSRRTALRRRDACFHLSQVRSECPQEALFQGRGSSKSIFDAGKNDARQCVPLGLVGSRVYHEIAPAARKAASELHGQQAQASFGTSFLQAIEPATADHMSFAHRLC